METLTSVVDIDRNTPPLLAIIVPCYNEEQAFAYCLNALSRKLQELTEAGKVAPGSYLLFVDDGSGDATWSLIRQAAGQDRQVRGIRLSRNRGHQVALWAGLKAAESDITITIDADLQDDVEAVGKMVDAYLEGWEVVYGVRDDRVSDSFFKRTTANLFYRLMQLMGAQQVANHADFRLLSDRARQALLGHEEANLYIRGLVPMVGFSQGEVRYVRRERTAGESKYPFHKMLQLAINGITSLSVTPLRIIALSGLATALLSVVAALWALANKLAGGTIQGWTSVMIAIFFLGGIQIFSIGIIGEYIGKIYLETKRRPKYFISERIGEKDSGRC
jgi:glycosyltransferase involved in cell wall biosynthesis